MFNMFYFHLESTIFTIISSKREASQISKSTYNTNEVMMNSKIKQPIFDNHIKINLFNHYISTVYLRSNNISLRYRMIRKYSLRFSLVADDDEFTSLQDMFLLLFTISIRLVRFFFFKINISELKDFEIDDVIRQKS